MVWMARQVGSTRDGVFAFCVIFAMQNNGFIAVIAALALIFFRMWCITKTSRSYCQTIVEGNVVMILVFGLCNWSSDIARPATSSSSINGLLYIYGIRLRISGRRKSKSRVFVIVVGIIFVFVNIEIYYYIYKLGSGCRFTQVYHTRE